MLIGLTNHVTAENQCKYNIAKTCNLILSSGTALYKIIVEKYLISEHLFIDQYGQLGRSFRIYEASFT